MSQKTPATPLTATIQPQVPVIPSNNTVTNPIQNKVEIIDVDKRTFLKLIGTAGISFFIFSLLGRRVDDIVFGKALQSQIGKIGYSPEDQITQTQPISEGYRITEIDDNVVSYYGFVNKDGNWLIMREDTENSSFRYAKGDTNFSQNWNDREKLNYVYYHNLF